MPVNPVLVVLDPGFAAVSVEDAHGRADWVTHAYLRDQADYLFCHPALKGVVFPGESSRLRHERPGFVACLLHEKLLVWLQIQRGGVILDFMKFEEFREILIMPKKDFTKLRCYQAIWGGVDLAVDPREKACELDSPAQVQKYMRRLQALESIIPVWPPSPEMLYASHKFSVIANLDIIAGLTNQYPRPHTEILKPAKGQSFDGFILKREGSDGCHHVIRPDQINPRKLPRSQGDFRWLKQSYVPALRDIGEWRVIMIDCRPLWVIHTAPGTISGDWVFLHREAGISLEHMESKLRQPYEFDDIMDPVGGTRAQRQHADEELLTFVTTTLNHLIKHEEDVLRVSSSLRVVARVDVGVMKGPDGRLGYFVNEVERGLAIGLFSRGNPRWALRFADEFWNVWSRWITNPPAGNPADSYGPKKLDH